MSKGSVQRPQTKQEKQQFNTNWERIFKPITKTVKDDEANSKTRRIYS